MTTLWDLNKHMNYILFGKQSSTSSYSTNFDNGLLIIGSSLLGLKNFFFTLNIQHVSVWDYYGYNYSL